MQANGIFEAADEATLKNIRKDLGEDPKRLEKQMELFKEWLKCEPYLPSHVEEIVVQNFIRHCKCDLEKAKKKFEKFLITRTRLHTYYADRNITDAYFDDIMLHRLVIPFPKLTPEGYRVGYGRLPKDADQFDFGKFFHFILVMVDVVLSEDTAAAYIGIIDMKNLSAKHIGKLNVKLLAEGIKLLYQVTPFRYNAMHFFNVPHVPDALITLIKKLVPQKIIDRTHVHKDPKDITKYLSKKMLPTELGGEAGSWDDYGDNLKKHFVNNKKWDQKVVNLKLNGTIPHHKQELYSFDDFEMGGSFRQLSID